MDARVYTFTGSILAFGGAGQISFSLSRAGGFTGSTLAFWRGGGRSKLFSFLSRARGVECGLSVHRDARQKDFFFSKLGTSRNQGANM